MPCRTQALACPACGCSSRRKPAQLLLLTAGEYHPSPAAGGRWFFLPGIASWRCSRGWELPSRELNAVAQGVREVARLLRSLYETFAEVGD